MKTKHSDIRSAILIGGKSTRMGTPKTLLSWQGQSLLVRIVDTLAEIVSAPVLIGEGEVPPVLHARPRLADRADAVGPLAGVMAALDSAPGPWLVCACDMPLISIESARWLIGQRHPDAHAILPVAAGRIQPLFALYETGARELLLALPADDPSPRRLARHDSVRTPLVPDDLADAWRNVNTPEDVTS